MKQLPPATCLMQARLHKLLRMFKKTGKDFVPAVVEPYLENVEKHIPTLYAAVEEKNFSECTKQHIIFWGEAETWVCRSFQKSVRPSG